MNYGDLETFVKEIGNAKEKNGIVNLDYRPPKGSCKTFHEYLKLFFGRGTMSNKNMILIGDLKFARLLSQKQHKNLRERIIQKQPFNLTNRHVLPVNLFLQLTI